MASASEQEPRREVEKLQEPEERSLGHEEITELILDLGCRRLWRERCGCEADPNSEDYRAFVERLAGSSVCERGISQELSYLIKPALLEMREMGLDIEKIIEVLWWLEEV